MNANLIKKKKERDVTNRRSYILCRNEYEFRKRKIYNGGVYLRRKEKDISSARPQKLYKNIIV